MVNPQSIIGNQIVNLKLVNSTNEYLKQEIKNGTRFDEGLLIFAENQYDGKGLGTNKWESAPGKNLILSAYLTPHFLPAADQFILNEMVSLSILDFINYHLPNTINKIKWPNDVYIHNNKVSGILINNTIGRSDILYSIVGIGININQQTFMSDAPNPVSLKQILGKNLNLEKCLIPFLKYFNKRYNQLRSGDIQQLELEYINSLYRLNEWNHFVINDQHTKVKIIGLGKFGKLKLETKSGSLIECDMKEIKFVI